MTETVNFKTFADSQNWSPGYVTKLKQAGRLVLNDKGDRVLVAESLQRIKETGGKRRDVKERHAENRENKPAEPRPQSSKSEAETRSAIAKADMEEMERDKLAGSLIPRDDVDAAMKFIGATVRSLLDVFPDQVAPIVVATNDLTECHAEITEHCRNVLVQLGDAIQKQCAALEKKTA